MGRTRARTKLILILMTIGIVWFFLFGIGYVSAMSERGIRATECGTHGCSDVVYLLSLTWTLTGFIVLPLIIPVKGRREYAHV